MKSWGTDQEGEHTQTNKQKRRMKKLNAGVRRAGKQTKTGSGKKSEETHEDKHKTGNQLRLTPTTTTPSNKTTG